MLIKGRPPKAEGVNPFWILIPLKFLISKMDTCAQEWLWYYLDWIHLRIILDDQRRFERRDNILCSNSNPFNMIRNILDVLVYLVDPLKYSFHWNFIRKLIRLCGQGFALTRKSFRYLPVLNSHQLIWFNSILSWNNFQEKQTISLLDQNQWNVLFLRLFHHFDVYLCF